jgi:hypothetical protein
MFAELYDCLPDSPVSLVCSHVTLPALQSQVLDEYSAACVVNIDHLGVEIKMSTH